MPTVSDVTALVVLASLLGLIWKYFIPRIFDRHERLVRNIVRSNRAAQARANETNLELAAKYERVVKEMLDRFDTQLQAQRDHDATQHDRVLEELRAMRLQSREDNAAYRQDMRALIEALNRVSRNGHVA